MADAVKIELKGAALARWQRLLTPGAPDECWLWRGRLDAKGYGFIRVNRLTTRVHRVAYALAHGGELPPKPLVVRHRCDRPACCNPAHLEPGTFRDNVLDRVARGPRFGRGEELTQSKLTDDAVRSIRARLTAGDLQRDIAADHGVTQAAISLIATGRTWAHVQLEPAL